MLRTDDPICSHSTGQFGTKAEFVKSIVSGKSNVEWLDYSDTAVHVYGNAALVKDVADRYHSKTNIVLMSILHVSVEGPSD